jgi:hypothetical protein
VKQHVLTYSIEDIRDGGVEKLFEWDECLRNSVQAAQSIRKPYAVGISVDAPVYRATGAVFTLLRQDDEFTFETTALASQDAMFDYLHQWKDADTVIDAGPMVHFLRDWLSMHGIPNVEVFGPFDRWELQRHALRGLNFILNGHGIPERLADKLRGMQAEPSGNASEPTVRVFATEDQREILIMMGLAVKAGA